VFWQHVFQVVVCVLGTVQRGTARCTAHHITSTITTLQH